jgi:hypothetical protein
MKQRELAELEARGELADPTAEQAFEAMRHQEWQDHMLEEAQRRVRLGVRSLHYDIYERSVH